MTGKTYFNDKLTAAESQEDISLVVRDRQTGKENPPVLALLFIGAKGVRLTPHELSALKRMVQDADKAVPREGQHDHR